MRKLYDPQNGPMRVAGFMSGTGSNLIRIIELERQLEREGGSPFTVAMIFSDTQKSNAKALGQKYGIFTVIQDLETFCASKGKPKGDMEVRQWYCRHVTKTLGIYGIHTIAYAGFMSIVTEPLLSHYLGVNVHPADLRVVENGKRKYVGLHGVRSAMKAGEKYLHSTTHLMEAGVDEGRILMVSPPVKAMGKLQGKKKQERRAIVQASQERLKQYGDWIVFPRTVLEVAQGNFAMDDAGVIHYKGKPIPKGIELEEGENIAARS